MHALGTELDFNLALAWRADTADDRLRLVAFWRAPMVDAAEFEADSWDVEFERGQGARPLRPREDRRRRPPDRRHRVLLALGRPAGRGAAAPHRGHRPPGRRSAGARCSPRCSAGSRRPAHGSHPTSTATPAGDGGDPDIARPVQHATVGGDSTRAAVAAHTAAQTLREAMERTRRLMFELRPVLLHEEGLDAAIRALTQDIAGECGSEYETHITVARLPEELEELVYRVCQEALANIRKHARARHVTIDMQADEELLCSIADDGVGFDLQRALDRNKMRLHTGLEAMIERVELAGGAMHFDAGSGEGTTIKFHVPLSSVAEPAATPVSA